MGYQFFNKLLLRTPTYSYDGYGHEALNECCKTDLFKTALLIGSRSLYDELEKKDFNYALLGQKQQYSVLKYFNRMCYRPTLFGLFAGYTLLSWKNGDSTIVLNRERSVLHSEPGQELSLKIGNLLNQKLKYHSTFRVNHSMYRVSREFRYYVWAKHEQKESLEFSLETFLHTPFITRLIRYCRLFRSIDDIVNFVVQQTGSEQTEGAAFVDSLIERQVLQSALNPAITGISYAEKLYSYCLAHKLTDKQILLTGKILNCFSPVSAPNKNTVNELDQLLAELEVTGVPAGRYYNSAYERIDEKGGLSTAFVSPLTESLRCLDLITGSTSTIKSIENFAHKFESKFEGRLIPLLQAMDPETGVGYGNLTRSDEGELLQTVGFKMIEKNTDAIAWTNGHRLLMKLWKQNSKTADAQIISIRDEDLASMPQHKDSKFPTGLSAIFRIINDRVYLEQFEGPGAVRLIGRLSLFTGQVTEMAHSLSRLEEQHNPDVIFAEIVHICDEYADNVNRRASFRSYEITVLCNSELPEEQQIALSDLHVKIQGQQVLLYSAKHKKRVIPRLSSAFNYFRNDLPVFRFLCDLQYHGLRNSFKLDLADFFPGLRSYPRVEYKNTILYLASWYLEDRELKDIFKTRAERTQVCFFRDYAKSIKLSRYFSVNRNDHQLVFDLENEEDIMFFAEVIKSEKNIILREFIPDRLGLVRDEGNGRYINQFIACMYNNTEVYKGMEVPPAKNKAVERKFVPGSEWLYLKIYCHPNRANELIRSLINRRTKNLEHYPWFFVRYNDPDYHVRLRLKIPADVIGDYLRALEKKLKQALRWELVEKVQADTYIRELERYGSELIQDVETAFYLSSELIAAFIKAETNGQLRYSYSSFALYTVNELLTSLFPDDTERIGFISATRDSFLSEYADPAHLRFRLDRQYRKLRSDLEKALNDTGYLEYLRIGSKFKLLKDSVHSLTAKSAYLDIASRYRLLADILHMHLNRIFVQDARKQETATYYFLNKFNISKAKRK